jgi:hypothetical protein
MWPITRIGYCIIYTPDAEHQERYEVPPSNFPRAPASAPGAK